ncbi:type IVB secretion system protein IcmH/DotU [Burkholderia gladioli]|uniref:Type IVB secretion system protein IcmH/DotU n=1 Tax=Burkholderia gladioli TaxID=28095 RepID=A0AB38U578_BURGA|nr:type IVB secretion system protein IcmH/DotU [Burkholderia gladioli]MBU9274982.1 type IVB secretion system protein IcmH/DotU [Burkholderia gladioli]PRE32389.1 type VI secretion system protein TssL [Burkholderia gladioli]UWX75125.1 type IVB secretion system protein IcmH/DotU [Burkholderia gladioli]
MSEDNRRDDRASRVDATVLRPQGSSSSGSSADDATRIMAPRATGADAGATVISGGAYAAAAGPGGARSAPRPALRAELGDFMSGVANPLVRAANPLLLLTVQLRHSVAPPADVARLREQAVAQVHSFESYAQGAGINTQTIMAARYVLCTMLDESVNNAPWGELSGWAQKTLLVTFHGETYGGAKFFQILDRLSVDFSRHLDLIELMYICLALGFGGRYLVEPGGLGRLADIQDDLYRRIRGLREAPAAELAPHWRGVEDRRNPVMRHVPLWVAMAAAAVILLASFLYFFTRLNGLVEPVSAQLAAIGLQNVPPPQANAAPKPAGKSLKSLLAPLEQAGALAVDEQPDGRATVRLAAGLLFPSGGADIAPAEIPLLRQVAAALNQVKGRVIVVGHTDDQPIRSLKFKDNFALSTARAQNTLAILAQGLDDPRRLEANGAGSSQPIATPSSLPENRARNRRVEILYIPEN